MADIELVVKMSEKDYKNCIEYDALTSGIRKAIQKGILLPKGHGKIIDIDKVLEEMKATKTYDIPFALERVKPIIEADKKNKKK